jgi:hypothetical protein
MFSAVVSIVAVIIVLLNRFLSKIFSTIPPAWWKELHFSQHDDSLVRGTLRNTEALRDRFNCWSSCPVRIHKHFDHQLDFFVVNSTGTSMRCPLIIPTKLTCSTNQLVPLSDRT